MKSEAVSISPRREALVENAPQILRLDSNSVVGHDNAEKLGGRRLNRDHHSFLGIGSLHAGMFGVFEQIEKNLQNFVAIHRDCRSLGEFADNLNSMAMQCFAVHAQGVIDNF